MMDEKEIAPVLDLITALQVGLAVTAHRAGVKEAVIADLERIIADATAMAIEAGESEVSCGALAELMENFSSPQIAALDK